MFRSILVARPIAISRRKERCSKNLLPWQDYRSKLPDKHFSEYGGFGRQAEVVINALSSFIALKVVLSRALFRFELVNQALGINPILPNTTNAKSYSMKIQVVATRNKLP